MNKKLLQISSAFAIQKIYVNLIKKLSEKGFEQIVYVPVRTMEQINGNRDDFIKNCDYEYSFILRDNLWFKLRYRRKIKIIFNDLISRVDITSIGLVHAHFLFSDGGVAYLLKKKYGIPYVVSVRATDLFYFFRLMVHLRKFGNRIMSEAEQVIFINPTYVNLFKKKYLDKLYVDVLDKFTIIPNAIDQVWFDEKIHEKKVAEPLRLLYVGQIIKRKKLDIVVRAMRRMNSKLNLKTTLDVVGEGPFFKKAEELFDENVNYHGKINDFEILKKVFKECDIFVMPSIKETFGLVYIEAMSQGLPIIYCKDEGVDGFFPSGEIGVAVPPDDINSTIQAIKHITQNYGDMSQKALKASQNFTWGKVSEKYIEVYVKASF